MDREEIYNIFRDTQAIMKGHFEFTSGKHSEYYIQCARMQRFPHYSEKLTIELAKKLSGDYDLIIGPAIGGIIIAYEMARYFGLEALFAERENGVMTIRRGFEIPPNKKVLVVEDVVTTGGSVKEVMSLVEESGSEIKDVAVLVDRSKGTQKGVADISGVPLTSLIDVEIEVYDPDQCPLCETMGPPIKPGSRKL